MKLQLADLQMHPDQWPSVNPPSLMHFINKSITTLNQSVFQFSVLLISYCLLLHKPPNNSLVLGVLMSPINQTPPTNIVRCQMSEKFPSQRPVYTEQELCSHAHSQIIFYIGTARLSGEAELCHYFIFKIKIYIGAASLPQQASYNHFYQGV